MGLSNYETSNVISRIAGGTIAAKRLVKLDTTAGQVVACDLQRGLLCERSWYLERSLTIVIPHMHDIASGHVGLVLRCRNLDQRWEPNRILCIVSCKRSRQHCDAHSHCRENHNRRSLHVWIMSSQSQSIASHH